MRKYLVLFLISIAIVGFIYPSHVKSVPIHNTYWAGRQYKDTVIAGMCVRISWANTSANEAVFYSPGAGQVGNGTLSDTQYVKLFGPEFWLLNGWDGTVTLGNGIHNPVFVTIIQSASINLQGFTRPSNIKAVLDGLIASRFHSFMKDSAWHCAGFSAGGWLWSEFNSYMPSAGNTSYWNYFKSEVDIEGVIPDDQFDASLAYPQKLGNRAKTKKFHLLGFEQINDTRFIWQIRDNMNDSLANSANFAWSNFGAGGHSNFNDFLNPSSTNWTATNANLLSTNGGILSNFIAGGQNVWQWMLRQGDTTLGNSAPTVSAGSNQTIILPTSTTTLSGTATGNNGATISSTTWSELSGPNSATITSPSSLTTGISGLILGTYTFQLSATDNNGLIGTSTMQVFVNNPSGSPVAHAGGTYRVTRENGYNIILDGSTTTGSNLKFSWVMLPYYFANDKVTHQTFVGAEPRFAAIKSPNTIKCALIQSALYNQDSVHMYKVVFTASDSVSGNASSDTATVIEGYGTRFPPQASGPGWHAAITGDLIGHPWFTLGDIVIDGGGSNAVLGQNTDVFLIPTNIFHTTGTTHRVWVKGGVYRRISINWDTTGSATGPLVPPAGMYDTLTNYDGQVECGSFYVNNTKKLFITGKYDLINHTGDVNFQGKDAGFAYSNENYGIFVNDMFQSVANLNFQWDGFSTDSCELSYVSSGYGGFTGFTLKPELAGHPTFHWNHFRIHDNIAYLVHGEAFYLGSANNDPVMTWNDLWLYNNIATMPGNKLFKTAQLYSNCRIFNNVGVYGSINYRAPFEENVSNAYEVEFRNGGNIVYNNLIVGAGEQLLNLLSLTLNPFTGSNNSIHNNAFLHSTGFIGAFGGQLDSVPFTFSLDSNYFGQHNPFLDSNAYNSPNGINTFENLRALPAGNLPGTIRVNTFNFNHTIYDSTKYILADGDANFNFLNTTLVKSIPLPAFVNAGFSGSIFPEQFCDTIFGTWGDEFHEEADTKQGQPTSYHVGDIVHWFKKFFRSNVNNNKSVPGLDGNWSLITFSNGGTLPPMDYRLFSTDQYALRNIGLGATISPFLINSLRPRRIFRIK